MREIREIRTFVPQKRGRITPEFLDKKHLNFGQGLEFLKFGQGNRGLNDQNRRKSKETIRKNEGKRIKIDKKIRGRDPYFLLKFFLLKKGVFWLQLGTMKSV